MENVENIEKILNELSKETENASMRATQFHLQFETMAELQKDELDNMRKHYTKIILSLILTIVLIISGIIGGAIYLLANYDLEFGYYQSADVGGDGTATIYDGIHQNDNSTAN